MLLTLPFPPEVLGHIWTRLRTPRRDGRVTIPAAQSNVFTTVAEFAMPASENGYLLGYQNEVIDATYDYGGSLAWQVTVQNATFDVDGESEFTELRGTRTLLADTLTRVLAAQTVRVGVRRAIASANPTICSASVLVVHWPIEIDRTFLTHLPRSAR